MSARSKRRIPSAVYYALLAVLLFAVLALVGYCRQPTPRPPHPVATVTTSPSPSPFHPFTPGLPSPIPVPSLPATGKGGP